jgi:hypothetical protein
MLAVTPPSPHFPKTPSPEIEAANSALVIHARSLPGMDLPLGADLEVESVEKCYDQLGAARLRHSRIVLRYRVAECVI